MENSLLRRARLPLSCSLVLVVLLAVVGYSSGGPTDTQSLTVLAGSRYKLEPATAVSYEAAQDGKRLDFYFTDNGTGAGVTTIYVNFQFDSTKYYIDDNVDTSQAHGYYNFASATNIQTVKHANWAEVSFQGFTAAHFNNTKLFGLTVKIHCRSD